MSEDVVGLDFELLSPCFLGGAYHQPELRMASLRGMWRYWYRALYGDGGETAGVAGEAELFGGVHGHQGGRSRVRLVPRTRIAVPSPIVWQRGPQGRHNQPPRGRDYLLFSLDLTDRKRSYISPRYAMKLDCRIDAGVPPGLVERAHRALAVAFAFGGVGARSRRMAGAVHLAASAPHPVFPSGPAEDPAALARRLQALIAPAITREVKAPRYHVVARAHFRAGVIQRPFRSWEEAMDQMGSAFREFRSRRRPDYDIAKELAQGRRDAPSSKIERAAFGLPIVFRFRSLKGSKATIQLPNADRRGSPLFLTLEKLADGRVAAVWSLFRAPIAPDGALIAKETATMLVSPGLEAVDQLLAKPAWASHLIAE